MAEGLAQEIANGTIPDILKDTEIFSLDLGALLAGTKYRGDFEQRFKKVINAIKKRENAVMFIDEIHTVVGAGATSSGSCVSCAERLNAGACGLAWRLGEGRRALCSEPLPRMRRKVIASPR